MCQPTVYHVVHTVCRDVLFRYFELGGTFHSKLFAKLQYTLRRSVRCDIVLQFYSSFAAVCNFDALSMMIASQTLFDNCRSKKPMWLSHLCKGIFVIVGSFTKVFLYVVVDDTPKAPIW